MPAGLQFSIDIDKSGLERLFALTKVRDTQLRIGRAVAEGIKLMERNITVRTPAKTGAARASILGAPTGTGLRGVVRSTLSYVDILEEGSRPHIIRPRRAKVLAFPGSGGGTVFTRFVRHPGTRAYHMFVDGTAASVRGVTEIFVKHMQPDAS